jgi:hypothetical protein
MDQTLSLLRRRLTNVRDRSLEFIGNVDSRISDEPKTSMGRGGAYGDIWLHLSDEEQNQANELRSAVRLSMAEIAQAAQRSLLVDEADIRTVGHNAKRMAAALRFKQFKHWGVYIHHDEGTYLGMDPPGQSENDPIEPQNARREFLAGYQETIDLMDLMTAKREQGDNYLTLGGARGQATISYLPGSAFVMMWISPERPELNDVRDVVREVFGAFGIKAIRADEIEHSDGITDRIVDQIRQSEYLFADLTGERPSVYYEIGFAHALGKPVILYRKKGTIIHFDLAYRNCPEYENLGDLRSKLRNRLTAMTNRDL